MLGLVIADNQWLLFNGDLRHMVNGVELRRYDNRITIVGADLVEIELEKYME